MDEKKYWFKRKRFGLGLYPASWQGWLSLGVLIVLAILNFHRIDATSHSASDTLRPVTLETVVLVLVFIGIAYWKGEKPLRWQWGKKEDSR